MFVAKRPASAEGRSRSTVGSRVPMDSDITALDMCRGARLSSTDARRRVFARLPRSRRGVATRRHRDSRILSRRHVPPRVGVDRPPPSTSPRRVRISSTPIRLVSSLLLLLLIRASPPSPSVRHDPRTRAGGPRDPSPIRPARRRARPRARRRARVRARARRPRRVRRPVPGGVELGHHGVARHRRARRPGRLRAISRGAALRPRRATAHRAQLRATRRRRRDHRRRSFPPADDDADPNDADAVAADAVYPVRFDVQISGGAVTVAGRRLNLPICGPGEFEVLYGDGRVRVFRSSGGVAVQVPSDWTPSSDEDA